MPIRMVTAVPGTTDLDPRDDVVLLRSGGTCGRSRVEPGPERDGDDASSVWRAREQARWR
jgi:hypothetical protein